MKANNFSLNPSTLFLVDGAGALITAVLLFFVLKQYHVNIDLPQNIIKFLAAIASAYSVYSFICFLFTRKQWPRFITIIAFANFLYCLLTAAVLVVYHSTITILGVIYFVVEILIIAGLATFELKMARPKKLSPKAPAF